MTGLASSVGEVFALLIPADGATPGGGDAAVVAAALSDPAARHLLTALAADPARKADPAARWAALAEFEPQRAAAICHLLTAAYFADPRVRARYALGDAGPGDTGVRDGSAVLAALLADVPHAPNLPERR